MAITPLIIDADQAGQRIDNFLITHLKGLPKSRIYRALRKGEVRINRCRAKPTQKLQLGDQVRVPPLRVSSSIPLVAAPGWQDELTKRIIFEDNALMVIDKPAGMPVHGGSGLNGGLIETLRQLRPQQTFLELVHRLDRQTSGCLLVAKKRQALLNWQQLLAQRQTTKQYLALVRGQWQLGDYRLDAPLQKNILQSGERMVKVNALGKAAVTLFHPLQYFANATLLEIRPLTGRTHQIRVHAAHLGHPLAGDDKYGDDEFNQLMRKVGLKRLFLHAGSISNSQQLNAEGMMAIGVRLAEDLQQCLRILNSGRP